MASGSTTGSISTVRRHHISGLSSTVTTSTAADMAADATLPRVWADNDDKHHKKKPAAAAKQNNYAALGRRVLAPVARSLWPCTPRKAVRTCVTLAMVVVMLLISMEAIGRLRINGY